MAVSIYVIAVFCICVLGGVNATDECSEPDTQQGRLFCAVIFRDGLCENGMVSNETCQNCTQLETYCGPLELTNETNFCENIDEDAIRYCPLFLAGDCTGDFADRTDEQLQRCDSCLVIEREECTAPPPEECYDFGIQLACNVAERLEQNYTCTELFPPEEGDEGGLCQFCEFYELICGRPHDEVNITLVCENDDIDVVDCRIASMREECVNMEDDLDPERALECAYCSIVVDANCTLPPIGEREICYETGLEAFCTTVLGEGLCPGTVFSERTCEDCAIFELACGPPEGDITDLCDDPDTAEACAEVDPICKMDEIPLENTTICEGCEFLHQRCGDTLPVKYPAKILPANNDMTCPSTEERDVYFAEIDQEINDIIRDTVVPALGLDQETI